MHSRIWILVAAGVLTTPALALAGSRDDDTDWCRDGNWGGRRVRHCEVREVAVSSRGTLDVNARPNGGVRVRGWDKDAVRLQVKVEATADTEAEAKALAGQVRVETDGTIRAVGPDRGRDVNWNASFRLDVPRQSDLRLVADNGGIHIEDVVGTASFETMNGGIHLKRVGGSFRGRTTNGGLHVSLEGSEWEGEGLDLRTTNGGVHLELPSDYNARLETGTVNGRVHADLPVTGRRHGRVGGQIEADLGRGGRLLRLETTNGGVHIGRD
jgi:DUF4097 and DUF4098 domain-containing protein YvlB